MMSKGNYFLRNQRVLSDHPVSSESISAGRQYAHSAIPVLSNRTVRAGYTPALNTFLIENIHHNLKSANTFS